MARQRPRDVQEIKPSRHQDGHDAHLQLRQPPAPARADAQPKRQLQIRRPVELELAAGSVYAFPTQSTYLAVNNFLDYFARYHRRCGLPATTVSLGFINDLGALTPDSVTVNLFVRAFVRDRAAAADWLGHAQDPLSAANIVTGIDPAVLARMRRGESKSAGMASVPRWYHDARASLMLQAVDDAWRLCNGQVTVAMGRDGAVADESPTVQLRRQFKGCIGKLRTADAGEAGSQEERWRTVTFVTDAIRTTVAGMLFVDVLAVKAANTVSVHGIDSLLAAEFRN
ncbi:hypothetical protein BDW62DRAFT_203016 [Aspergillus aurantiobrunneus]